MAAGDGLLLSKGRTDAKFKRFRTSFEVEAEARRMRDQIIGLAAQHDYQSDAIALALADVLAALAVTLDRETGHQGLADRLHAFEARVEESYRKGHEERSKMDLTATQIEGN